MTNAITGKALLVGLAALLALTTGLGAFKGLTRLATPGEAADRLRGVEKTTERVERLGTRLAAIDSTTYPARALCRGPTGPAAAAVEGRIKVAATAAALTPATTVTPPTDDGSGARIIRYRISGQGPYDRVTGFLSDLSRAQPVLFVDRLDLSGHSATASFQLTGRVVCEPLSS